MQKQARRASSMEGTSRMGKSQSVYEEECERHRGQRNRGENSYVGMTMNNLE